MLMEYIQAALEKAHFEIIKDKRPYYGEIRGLRGVWANGKSLEDCRRNLEEVLEGWLLVRLRKGLAIPKINGVRLRPAARFAMHV